MAIPILGSSGSVGYTAYALATFLPPNESENADLVLDIKIENEWEATSDWNEDDVEAVTEGRGKERSRAWRGKCREEPMDLS